MRGAALSRTVLLTRQLVGARGVTDGVVLNALCSTRVRIVADAANLASPNGQTLVATLAGQILAMGCTVRLDLPDVAVEGYQPPLIEKSLRSGLVSLAADLIPGQAIDESRQDSDHDHVFVIGDSQWRGHARMAWRVGASRWRGWTAPIHSVVGRLDGDFPIGSLIAASVAAPEAYKAAVRSLGVTVPVHPAIREQVAPVAAAAIALGDDDWPSGRLEIGCLDLISGGAISHAALHALLRVPSVRAEARVLEPDRLDVSNLNRYPLARRSRVRNPKIDVLSEWSRPNFTISGQSVRVDADSLNALRPLAEHVLVGVDHIPSRWVIQRGVPGWLGVGSTASFITLTSEHDGIGGCAGCLHPCDDDVEAMIPTVSFVSYWAGLLVAVRLLRKAMGLGRDPARQALCLTPLRLDLQGSFRWQPVLISPRCPVGHAAPTGGATPVR